MLGSENRLNFLSASEAIQKIRKREISVSQLMEDCIRHVEALEPEIRAWKCFDGDLALLRAREFDERVSKGENLGPLWGMPVGVKDIFNTIEFPTCMGSPVWEGFTSGNDARVVSYIKWADGVVPGKTVTAEFAVHYPGPTVNPNNYGYSPGTSSSGSAAAVAAHMVPLAIGTQTAGSTTRPASYCGIFGFKPSFGLIPRTGVLKTLDTLDHVTILSRHIDDVQLLFDVLRVKGPNFPYVNELIDSEPMSKDIHRHPWKVAFIRTSTWKYAKPYAKNALFHYLDKIQRMGGVEFEQVELPTVFEYAHEVHDTIYTKALSYYFREEYEKNRQLVSDVFCEIVERGRKIGIKDYLEGLEKQKALRHTLDGILSEFDIGITLSTSSEAPMGLHGKDLKDSCLVWTLCHVPALNLPVFRAPNGMPFGAQIFSKRYTDNVLLSFARLLKENGLVEDWRSCGPN